jgi:hypothetical protein
MFHMFHVDVAGVSSRCYKNLSSIAYVTIAINACCKCMF